MGIASLVLEILLLYSLFTGAIPDILVLGKPMANGHPISAVMTRSELCMKFTDKYGPHILDEVHTILQNHSYLCSLFEIHPSLPPSLPPFLPPSLPPFLPPSLPPSPFFTLPFFSFLSSLFLIILIQFVSDSLSLALANTVMDIISDEKLQENALAMGNYVLERLKALKEKYQCIGDVR